MEEKRLDFNAPLISVRRVAALAGAASSFNSSNIISTSVAGRPPVKRSSLPVYNSELKSGPVGSPGVIPFRWEKTPGQPKGAVQTKSPVGSRLPPGKFLNEKDSDGSVAARRVKSVPSVLTQRPILCEEKNEEEEEEEQSIYDDAFSDAFDTLSRTESLSMDCSVSGQSSIADAMKPSGSFSKDPQLRDFMMSRFLHAAQAIATGPLESVSRKPPRAPPREPLRTSEKASDENRGKPLPHPYNIVSKYARAQEGGVSYEVDGKEEEEEEENYGASNLSSKACGLVPRFCLKSSLFLLNPVPGMKLRSHLPPSKLNSRIKISDNRSLGQATDEHSWEAVYKYKLGREEYTQRDNESKLTSESNRLTYWSDSQTADGSSSYHPSTGGWASPYTNEVTGSSFREGKGFLGVPKRESKSRKAGSFDSSEKIGERYWKLTSNRSRQERSGSMSLSIERPLYIDSVDLPETPNSMSSSLNTPVDNKRMVNCSDKNSEVAVDSQTVNRSLVLQTYERDVVQPKFSEAVEPGLLYYSGSSNSEEMDDKDLKKHGNEEGPLRFEVEDQDRNNASLALALLPPPLPKSPSESWLQRTLPSVLSNNPSPQTFLGTKFHNRKQTTRALTNGL